MQLIATIFTTPHFHQATLVAIVGALYLLVLVAVRWNLIAVPWIFYVQSVAKALKHQLSAFKTPAASTVLKAEEVQQVVSRTQTSLTAAEGLVKPRLLNILLWSRRNEFAALGALYDAKCAFVELGPRVEVEAQFDKIEDEMRASKKSSDQAQARKLAKVRAEHDERSLRESLLALIYARAEKEQQDLDLTLVWHNKTMWLITCGILLMVLLTWSAGQPLLFLFGAMGGFLSRMSRLRKLRKEAPLNERNDDQQWATLFWSPILGAVTGWTGALLLSALVPLHIIGPEFNAFGVGVAGSGETPFPQLAFATALLFGFSERLFDLVSAQLETTITSKQGSPPSPLTAERRSEAPPPEPPQESEVPT